MVLDEFSRSYERREFSYTILRHFCKGCGGLLDWVEDGDEMQFVCEGCGMVHTWQLDDPSGFIFLAPPEGTLVLAAPPDY